MRDSGELTYLIDDSGRLTANQVHGEGGAWRPANAKTHLPYFTDKSVWFRLRIAASASDRSLILYYPQYRQDVLDVYALHQDQVVVSYETGVSRPFASRPLPYTNYLFPLTLRAHESLDVYIRVRGYAGTALSFLQIWPEAQLLAALPKLDAFDWAVISAMSVVLLVSCIVWLFGRHRIFVFFVLLVATQLFVYLISGGYAFEWFWPTSPATEALVDELLIPVSLCVDLGFSMAFLNLRSQAPRLFRSFLLLLGALVVLCRLLGPFWPVLAPKYRALVSILRITTRYCSA